MITDIVLPQEQDEQYWTNNDTASQTASQTHKKKLHCTKHDCKLVKMRVWKNEFTISGFEAIFEYPDLMWPSCADNDQALPIKYKDKCLEVHNQPSLCSTTVIEGTGGFNTEDYCCDCDGLSYQTV